METFVARQPIFDRQKKLYAYELLFRDGLANFVPEDMDGDMATSKLLSGSFYTIGMEKMTNSRKAFINFTQSLIIDEIPLLFPNDLTVIEILEDVEPVPEVIQAIDKFSKNGFIIALDDFVFEKNLKPLIALANIIKIDFRLTDISEIERLVQLPEIKKTKLLAEKVEDNEEFNNAMDLGFEYFQGYFFSKPEIIQGKEISTSKLSLLQIMAEINRPDFNFNDIETIMSRDLSISYKLLRYINSAFFRRVNEITTIKEALVYLGEDELRRFISLIILSKVAEEKTDELIKISCIHAKFCENLGTASNCMENPDELFTVGLFSTIDSVLDQPMDKIMENLPLSKKISDALTGREGEMGKILALAENYVKGNWDHVSKSVSELCIVEESIPPIYLESCGWADALTG